MALLIQVSLVGLLAVCTSAKLADYVTPCSAKDPELNACVLKQANIFYPFIVKGIKEFGILPMEPLLVPLVQLEQSGGLSFNVTDSKHFGWDTAKYTKANIDPKNFHFEFDVKYTTYSLVGQYEVSGRILVLPITGNGFANVTFGNANIKLTIDGEAEQRNGKTYMKLTTVEGTILNYEKLIIRLDNLFGNKELSDSMNVFLNGNTYEVFKQLEQPMNNVVTGVFTTLLTRLFNKLPYNHMFKDLDLE